MKKMVKIAFVAAFVAIAGYGVYITQGIDAISDLSLANVDALASSNEYEPGNECSGCIMNCVYICKVFGDWGGCIGDPFVHRA
ncbi:NVEALA domain-containing protein [uncultured Bacteroides sp.]|uniref:NVEALA domain-containing protein n=1 Tax=uncultured Bacteroides sp. TaxID=162156 RepID=UPI00280B170F|nr:NVEALA domain-containing protein [uncultured Bacteroides sp.]